MDYIDPHADKYVRSSAKGCLGFWAGRRRALPRSPRSARVKNGDPWVAIFIALVLKGKGPWGKDAQIVKPVIRDVLVVPQFCRFPTLPGQSGAARICGRSCG